MKASVLFAAATVALMCISNPCFAADKPTAAKSSIDKNKQTARIWYEEGIIKGNSKALDPILAKGVVMELAPSYASPVSGSYKVSGADQVKKHVDSVTKGAVRTGEIVDLVAEGNKVAMYRVVTQKMPDGRTVVVPWVSFFEFDDAGKITKIKHVHDTLHEKNQMEKKATAPVTKKK